MPTVEGQESTIHYEQVGRRSGHRVGLRRGRARPTTGTPTNCRTSETRSATPPSTIGASGDELHVPLPWTMDDFARDTAELIRAGLRSTGGARGSVAGWRHRAAGRDRLPRPGRGRDPDGNRRLEHGVGLGLPDGRDRVRRKAGGRLDGMMALTHYAAMAYPRGCSATASCGRSCARSCSPTSRRDVARGHVISQWEPCALYDQRDQLRSARCRCTSSRSTEDVQAPPQDGREVAELAPQRRVPPVRRDGPLLDLWPHARRAEPVHQGAGGASPLTAQHAVWRPGPVSCNSGSLVVH